MFKCAITKKSFDGVPHKIVVQYRETVHTHVRRTYNDKTMGFRVVRWPEGVGFQIAKEILVSDEAMMAYVESGYPAPGPYFATVLGIEHVIQIDPTLRESARACARQLRDARQADERGDGMPGVSGLFARIAALLTTRFRSCRRAH